MRVTRKHILRSVVAIIVGVVATVVVSWIATWVHTSIYWDGPFRVSSAARNDVKSTQSEWVAWKRRYSGYRALRYAENPSPDGSIYVASSMWTSDPKNVDALPSHMRHDLADPPAWHSEYFEAGWPMYAMTYCEHRDDAIVGGSWRDRAKGGLVLSSTHEGALRVLPLTPIIPGFLVNTLFYATIWLCMTLGFGAWRSRRRVKGNRCASCGYSREGLEPLIACPECGTVPTRA